MLVSDPCSCLQGLSEPVGALVALLLVKPFLTEGFVHYLLAFVGGIMVGRLMSLCILSWLAASKQDPALFKICLALHCMFLQLLACSCSCSLRSSDTGAL